MGCYSIAGYPPPAPFLHILRHKHRQGRCDVKYWVKQQKFQLFSVVTCGLSTFFFGFIAAAFFIAFIQLLWFGVRKIWTEPQTSICGKQNQKYVSHLDGKHSKGSSAFRVSYKNLAMSESFLFLWPVYFLERGHMGTFCTATVYGVEKTFTLFNASKVLFKTVLSRIVGRTWKKNQIFYKTFLSQCLGS